MRIDPVTDFLLDPAFDEGDPETEETPTFDMEASYEALYVPGDSPRYMLLH